MQNGHPVYNVSQVVKNYLVSALLILWVIIINKLVFNQQPIMMGVEDEVSEEAKDNLLESMGVMEIFLKDKPWIAGDDLTIADLTVLALISTVEVVVFPIDPERFPRLADWFERAKQLPYFEECNKEALEQVAELAKHETPLI